MNNSYKVVKYISPTFCFALLFMILAFVESVPARRPRFIAIPLEDVHLVELEDIPNMRVSGSSAHTARVPRHAPQERKNDPDSARFERQAHDHHHHQYVDFGAHTGHHGSFGWYADFPVKDPGH